MYGDDLGNVGAVLPAVALSGLLQWSDEYRTMVHSPLEVAGGNVYFSYYNLLCYNATTFEEKWVKYGPFVPVKPLYHNGHVYAKDLRTALLIADAGDGGNAHSVSLAGCVKAENVRMAASGDDDVFVACAGHVVYRVRPDLTVDVSQPTDGIVWDMAVTPTSVFFSDDHGSVYRLERSLFTQSYMTPPNYIIVGAMDGMGWPSFMDGHVLFGSTDGNLYVVSADSGDTLFTHRVSGGASKPLIADNVTVTVTSVGGFMDTLHRDKGSYVVSRSVRVDASPDPRDPGLPTVSPDGISLFSNANGIFVYDSSLKLLWRRTAAEVGRCTGRPYIVNDFAVVVCGGDFQTFDLRSGEPYLRVLGHADDIIACNNEKVYIASSGWYTMITIPPKASHD